MGWSSDARFPRQELVNTVQRTIGDALQDLSQIKLRIQILELGRAEQAINGRLAEKAP
jgi:hypothetical protein